MRSLIALILIAFTACAAVADDAAQLPPIKPIPRLLPPKGIDIPANDLQMLEDSLIAAQMKVLMREKGLRIAKPKIEGGDSPANVPANDGKPGLLSLEEYEALKPDFEVYFKAVRFAIDFGEFYNSKDPAKAHEAIRKGAERAAELHAGKPSWVNQRGLLVRGYRSDIDGSVQPYGLHIPENLDLTKPVPLLVWLHGRGDKETDLHFIANREKNKGEFAPDWCITLHPYGRGTIGFKFAGEIDVLDAIESVKQRYKIDEDRIALAGFSMGGAGAWHIGAHYADQFCVVHAGAGFVETAKYNRLTPDKYPAWYEQKLWGWYDVPCYTRNLFNVPVIAYSGENDKQIQAAREMEAAFKAEGRELNHIIGPGVGHKYEAKAKEEVLRQIKAAVDRARDRTPSQVHFQTRTLRYNRMHWVEIEQMTTHWDDARLDVKLDGDRIEVKTRNVQSFILHPTRDWRLDRVLFTIDGHSIAPNFKRLPGDTYERFVREDGRWVASGSIGLKSDKGKLPGMQGTIDDAFMEPFILVRPAGRTNNPRVNRWADFEFRHCVQRWRAVFRGDPRIMEEAELGEEFKTHHLVLWGDPHTHRWMSMIIKGLRGPTPIGWTDEKITVGDRTFSSKDHVPVFIARNTYNPQKYVVINSGPTFREGHDRTNSQQTPKLPDWAIIGLEKDPDAFAPGEIKAAGFFDENWQIKKDEK